MRAVFIRGTSRIKTGEEARGESCHRVDWFFGWAHRFPIVFVFLFLIFLFVFPFYREASPVCFLYSPFSI
jgi:hypothetical protein